MPRLSTDRVPKYRRHKPSGKAVVTIDGRDFYLGNYGTKASKQAYDRLIGQWVAAGRCLPKADGLDSGPSIAEVARAYLRYAKGYYRNPDGTPTSTLERVKVAIRVLRETYGTTPAREFGPLALQAIQQRLADSGKGRVYVNYLTDAIKRVFRWAASQELLPVTTYQAVATVPNLKKGRTTAPDREPVKPVADELVQTTLPYLPEIVADMVRLQRLTGCRPGEVCIVRPCDVDTTGEVWHYRPVSHKTERHGRLRVVCLGPKAQDILRPYLLRPSETFCFRPVDSEKRRRAEHHARRTTPLSYGNRPGTNRKRKPKRSPGEHYTTNTYRRAIHRAVETINRQRKKQAASSGHKPELLPRWSPNRLRHSAATEIRKQFGLEAAQVALGHATADVTQVYAERDLKLAREVMQRIG